MIPSARALLLWPLATLLTIAISPSGQYRALDGFAIPIALLAVRAWPSAERRLVALAALAAALAPFAVFAVGAFGHLRSPDVTAYTEPAPSDVRAVRARRARAGRRPAPRAGALGTAIPALTDVSRAGSAIRSGRPSYGVRKQQSADAVRRRAGGRLSCATLIQTHPAACARRPMRRRAASLEAALHALGYAQTASAARASTRALGSLVWTPRRSWPKVSSLLESGSTWHGGSADHST